MNIPKSDNAKRGVRVWLAFKKRKEKSILDASKQKPGKESMRTLLDLENYYSGLAQYTRCLRADLERQGFGK